MRMIFVLVVLVVAVIFAVQNATVVTLDVFAWQLEASLAVIIAVCFAIGAIVAALALMPDLYRRRSDERRLQARIADLEAEHSAHSTQAASHPPEVHAPQHRGTG